MYSLCRALTTGRMRRDREFSQALFHGEMKAGNKRWMWMPWKKECLSSFLRSDSARILQAPIGRDLETK